MLRSSGNVRWFEDGVPQVVRGAMLSRFSRSASGLDELQGEFAEARRASDFYERVLDGYGDDSIAELGGMQMALQDVSIAFAMRFMSSRAGGSYIERSTRYVEYDGEAFFDRDLRAALGGGYERLIGEQFRWYTFLRRRAEGWLVGRFPSASSIWVEKQALDLSRGLIPLGARTSFGVHGNGRFWANRVRWLRGSGDAECARVYPHVRAALQDGLREFVRREVGAESVLPEDLGGVGSLGGVFLQDLGDGFGEVASCRLVGDLGNGIGDFVLPVGRRDRRDMLDRGYEAWRFRISGFADMGIFRDLRRHRYLTSLTGLKNFWSNPLHFSLPLVSEFLSSAELAGLRKFLSRLSAFILASRGLGYWDWVKLCPLCLAFRWDFLVDLRSLVHMVELRTRVGGHLGYRSFVGQCAGAVAGVLCYDREELFPFGDFGNLGSVYPFGEGQRR